MKDQDLMRALSSLPQDMLDEFADWQENRTPLSDADLQRVYDTESTKKRKISAAEHVPAAKKRGAVKQKAKNKSPLPRLFPWNIGIGAAAVAAVVVAVSVGKEAIGQRNQMQVGMNSATSVAEQLSESEPILIHNNCTEGIALAMDIPAGGTAQVLHSKEDAEPWIAQLQQNAENGSEFGAGYSPMLETLKPEAQYQDYDLIFAAVPYHYFNPYHGITEHTFMGGTITKDGKLTVEAGFVKVSDGLRTLMLPEIETFCCCFAVPKNSVPEITDFAFKDTFWDCTGSLPDDVITQGEQGEFLCSLPQHQEFAKMTGEAKYLYWADDEEHTKTAELPEDCEEVQEIREDAAQEPFPAWYWVNYRGTSIPVTLIPDKQGIAVDLIRTAADGEKYLTGDPEQDQTPLRTQLSKEWLETGFDEAQVTDPVSGTVFSIDPEHPVQDMLFVGVPAAVMPGNVVRWTFHNGTITPSGKLHLDFSVQTVSDTAIKALNAEYDDDTNFYFFISIPDGSIPELTDYEVTFSTYYTSAEPDAYTAEAPDETGTDGMNRRNTWLSQQPESTSYWSSVLGAKYITPIPEEQPGTAAVTDSFSGAITPPLENQPIVSVLPCGDIDTITLVLPIHDADAAAVLSDLHVSADGILSVTLNEYYEKNGVDLTQDTAWYQWMLGVPHGSLPEIKDMDIRRVNCDTEDAFLQIAGQLCTITTE